MSENPSPVLPPPVAASETVTPAPEIPPVGEASLPPPSAEQTQVADKVFSAPQEANAALTVAGVWTGLLILHDVARETFDTSEEEEEELPAPPRKDEGPAPGEE
jgi:hypothetical protein